MSARHTGKRYNNRRAQIRYRRIKAIRSARTEQQQLGGSAALIMLSGDVHTGRTEAAEAQESLVMSITTCGRRGSTLLAAVANTRRAGFTQVIHVFAEPNSVPDKEMLAADANLVIHRNTRQLGCYKNWKHAMEWMRANTVEDWVLSLQDDVVWCEDAAVILQYGMETVPKHRVGFLSPYTSPAMVPDRAIKLKHHWICARKRNFWGAIAMCFPREALSFMVNSKRFKDHKHHRQVDVVAGDVFFHSTDVRQPIIHLPSLADHIGVHSTIGRDKNPHSEWGRCGFKFSKTYEPPRARLKMRVEKDKVSNE